VHAKSSSGGAETNEVIAPDALLAITAEQLRVPLTTLQLQLHSLTRSMTRSPNLPAAQFSPRVLTILGQARRLADMVDAAEDVSLAMHGELQAELCWTSLELGEVIRTVVHDAAERAREQGCLMRVSIDQPLWGEWDPARVRRMVAALVHNALQYAPGKPIVVATKLSGECAYVEVRDQGPGVSDIDLARMHESILLPRRSQSGSGTGLWLAARVARAMGGTVSGKRAPTGGSIFCIELPLSPPTQPIGKLTDLGPRPV